MHRNIFEKTVIDNFRFLQDRYGFSAPVTEDFGREIFVKYERANQTVSISCEFGSNPIVEIFYPSMETGENPVPWASKNNMLRSRRISKAGLSTRFSDDENSIIKYIKEMSIEFEIIELKWLDIR